ncbi:MAG: SUF system NifU family Fe-S cluster assembly protein [Ignavibacteria bacterium]|nr:SUF system NifU family Fe-S cluster assembly protein [Ignavibacteria bacterium]MBI3765663.1 SUF system NifU family Fe-S cluster assembly protein [Ignavibacteriales bacterium]
MSALRELYQEVILDHNKSPRNFRRMEKPDRKVEGYNPLCGDHYTIFLKLENDIIKDICFEGAGCAISKASASVMSSLVKGKTKAEAEMLFNSFHRLVTGESDGVEEIEKLGKLAAFSGVSEFPARVKCASLAWHTLHAALASNEHRVSTE